MKNFNRLIKQITFISVFLFAVQLSAQNIAITDEDGYTAKSTAMLDVNSNSKGMLVPRLSSTERIAIINPATGLMVFDTNLQCFFYYNGTAWVNLLSASDYAGGTDASLFAVVNQSGDTVFAVYPGGVRINVDNSLGKISGSKGGFAVGGFSSKLTDGQDYLRVTNDSVRIYVDDNPSNKLSGSKGGFAVGGFSSKKASSGNYLHLTPDNYFIGHEAGMSIDEGLYNSFLGYKAGSQTDAGNQNVFFGYRAGMNNTYGNYNTFVGTDAGFSNTSGRSNICIGNAAGLMNEYSSYTVMIGDSAGANNTYPYNIFIGNKAGIKNNDGRRNLFIGYMAGKENVSGGNNTYIGTFAADENTGEQNTFVGYWSGGGRVIGDDNTFLGYRAGVNSSGDGNVFIGHQAAESNNGNNQLIIETDKSSSPLIYGEFDNDILKFNANVGIGTNAGSYKLNVNGNLNISGNYYNNGSLIGLWSKNGSDIYYNSGDVAIGTTSSSYKLYVVDNTASIENAAIYGIHDVTDNYGIGVEGHGRHRGVYGYAREVGTSGYPRGVYGYAYKGTTAYGVYGYARSATTNYGIYGYAYGGTTNWAGYFSGNVRVTGTVDNSKSILKIDNPLDPENKYLVHSSVVSPDMMTVYNGNVTTDSKGFAIVKMPNYFDALNKDFRYQLTVIGSFSQAIIYKKIVNNQFIIQTDKPNVEVSWQVTGKRNDPYAVKHPVKTEVDKADSEKGFYLHPELYRQPKEKTIGYEKENEKNIESKLLIE
ncbi:MAG: hypothetical protein DRJ01_15775 [Bacteroidetes bacterium]|nr:MAG: hypothetical protein DRJ01_15775 [Bacteroidota bacterium]